MLGKTALIHCGFKKNQTASLLFIVILYYSAYLARVYLQVRMVVGEAAQKLLTVLNSETERRMVADEGFYTIFFQRVCIIFIMKAFGIQATL